MELGRKAAEDISGVEEEIYNRASSDNTRLEQENKSGSRCIRFFYKRSIVGEV